MELGPREIVQFSTILVGLASGYAMIRSQLSQALKTITKLSKQLQSIELRMDTVEAGEAVQRSQLSTITGILSPSQLRQQSERDGAIEERLKNLERETSSQRSMHNSKHP